MGTEQNGSWWVLGFSYEAVIDAWQDARLAAALEDAWNKRQRPGDVKAWWIADGNEFAFRWFLNDAAARVLDEDNITWRTFVIGRAAHLPDRALNYIAAIT